MNWFLKNIKEISLGTLFTALVVSITFIVNLNRDIAEAKANIEKLEKEKFDESKTRFIVQQEISEMKGDVRDIKNWIFSKSK